ncbi:isocitrate dehydrogenase [NAD] subunit gamma, mitochondrial-like [Rhincodon typus]|uniref:isocitrate dehydrogenase [NAD] subunit gamma, mitochondrial-like n=1 Tax=Rhincodon typus TaxID=259920 RepID=UPI00202ED618|nr:isocitrate dehydrogenase [NAD] subunit gamma, mitochondrial-like [Rhincodon typus]
MACFSSLCPCGLKIPEARKSRKTTTPRGAGAAHAPGSPTCPLVGAKGGLHPPAGRARGMRSVAEALVTCAGAGKMAAAWRWAAAGRALIRGQVFGATLTIRRELSAFVTDQTIPPPAMYGGRHTVTMVPGDGIGPELMQHVQAVFRCACVPVDFEVVDVRPSLSNEADIEGVLTAIRRNRVALKGEWGFPWGAGVMGG